jgi:tRNA splicing ligase
MEKAKEAVRKERLLAKQRDEKNIADQNPELEGFVIICKLYECSLKFFFFYTKFYNKRFF